MRLQIIPFLACVATAFALPAALAPRQGTGSVTSSAGLAFYDPNFAHGTAGNPSASTYTCYGGPPSNFPSISKWQNFNAMWSHLKAVAVIPIGDTQAEATDIYNAIVSISQAAKVDARVILGVIIVESTGNVNVKCTNNGVENCGLMQSHDPVDQSFNAANAAASITQMVRDGTQGTPNGPGLVQLFNDNPNTGLKTGGNLWEVLRGYNSGAVNPNHISYGLGANPNYVSDIANYLLGWQGYGQSATTQKCDYPQGSV